MMPLKEKVIMTKFSEIEYQNERLGNMTPEQQDDLRVESLKGHARGWSYTPVKGKRAYIYGWQSAKRETIGEIEQWASEGNLGIRTGSSELLVLDIDSDSGLNPEMYPPTSTVETGGGGFHLYYTAPPFPAGNSHKAMGLPDHVHIRGIGGYVVAAGSIHPETGNLYRWAEGKSPDELEPAPFPVAELVTNEDFLERIKVWEEYHGRSNCSLDITACEVGLTTNQTREHLRCFGLDLPKSDIAKPAARRTPPTYGRLAMAGECHAVANCEPGNRNNQLNTSAFNLGQLVGSMVLDRMDVESNLKASAEEAGMRGVEIYRTIKSGIDAGIKSPRKIPEKSLQKSQNEAMAAANMNGEMEESGDTGAGTKAKKPKSKPTTSIPMVPTPSKAGKDVVLVPGSHIDDMGVMHAVGTNDFSGEVLASFPEGLMVRKATIPGQLIGEAGKKRFEPVGANNVRLLIDEHSELAKWAIIKTGDHKGEPIRMFVHSSRDHGELVLAGASQSPLVSQMEFMANYPFFRPDWEISSPGWNGGSYYYDQPNDLEDIELEHDRDVITTVLEDLLIDFPFKTESDRQNFIGLLFTPLIRPAIKSNCPLHLILSPLERTGKSLLAESVLGIIVAGNKTPGMLLPEHEEERDKRVTAMLMQGKTIMHLDNLKEFLDSACIASLLTATTYQGRLLGKSQLLELANNTTIVATGNNVRATGEIAKRTIPICLQPNTSSPETRQDFVHPDLTDYLVKNRKLILGCLLGAVVNWVIADKPKHNKRLGGFDTWSETVGGIMDMLGLTEWRKNEQQWRRDSDPLGEDLLVLASVWWELHGQAQIKSDTVMGMAEANGVFGHIFTRPSERAKQIALGRFLTSQENKPVGRWIIRRAGTGSNRWYYLEVSRFAEAE